LIYTIVFGLTEWDDAYCFTLNNNNEIATLVNPYKTHVNLCHKNVQQRP